MLQTNEMHCKTENITVIHQIELTILSVIIVLTLLLCALYLFTEWEGTLSRYLNCRYQLRA